MRNTPKTRPSEAATRAAIPLQLKRNLPDTSKFSTPGPVFFLVFACESVEPYPTILKSTTYKRPSHGSTQTVNQ